jgi:hypothetical protein
MLALALSRSSNRPVPSSVPAPQLASTVAAALRSMGRSTAYRYVTLYGPTHDDAAILERPGPTTRPACLRAETLLSNASYQSLNSEPGCIKVVDTFRCANRDTDAYTSRGFPTDFPVVGCLVRWNVQKGCRGFPTDFPVVGSFSES